MRNAIKKSQSKSKNFVKRVLSKTNSLNASGITIDKTKPMEEEKPPVNIEMELFSLKKQIDGLQKSVNTIQYDNENKEAALAKLARDKEQLHTDLNKQRRSNTNLVQQLEDERKFYFKEKEQYCIEMNETKKLKQKLNETNINSDSNLKEIFRQKEDSMQKEIQNLKEHINVTLEANYNLSVKFLRMKNTKFCLKNRLKRLQMDHNTAMQEFGLKLERVEKEMAEIVHKEFLSPITPSSKKYLQLVKYNGQLIHENLELQQNTERLQLQLDRIKMQQVREETNQKLQYYKKRSRSEGATGLSSIKHDVKYIDNNNYCKQIENDNVEEKVDEKMEKLKTRSKNCDYNIIRHPSTPALPIIPSPLRTSPSLDIQTLYERKKSSHRIPNKHSSIPSTAKHEFCPNPKARVRVRSSATAQAVEYSRSSSITIQPLDNSKAVTLPADVVPSCTNLRLLCKSENEGSEGGASSCGEGADSSSYYGRRMNATTSTDVIGGAMVSSIDLLQVSNCTSNPNTEVSFYTTVYNDSRPQSAPAGGTRGTNTAND